jgi:hypothetical protein
MPVFGTQMFGSGSTSTSYRYWRFNVTDSYATHGTDPPNEVAVGQVKLFVDTTQYPTVNMTSNTAPSPLVASASSEDTPPAIAYQAFDSGGREWSSQFEQEFPQWVQVDLGSGNEIAITSYKIKAGEDGKEGNGPKSWTLQASNDNSEFDTLDTQTDVGAWSENQERTYTI